MDDGTIVSTDWLADRLGAPGIVVLDAAWYVPESGRKGAVEFAAGHIPGARHFDLDAMSDRESPYVNMLPTAAQFARDVGQLGIGNDTLVVAYDASYVSARVWWMFKTFGHEHVRILDGGLRKWRAEGRPVETGRPAPASPATFVPRRGERGVVGWDAVLEAIESGSHQLLDARTADRFAGGGPSGYPGVPSGHMPGAVNIPWSRFLRQDGDATFVSPDEARAIFDDAGVRADRPAISTCGSGVTACLLGLMLERAGQSDWVLYDGSWHEWGQRPDLPKVLGDGES